MGRGPKKRTDPPMRPPVDILAAVEEVQTAGEGSTPSGQEMASVCAARRSIPFLIKEDASIAVGDLARLGGGQLPPVISNGKIVGEVPEPQASVIRGCQRLGYVMQGTVTAVNPAAGTGGLLIAGEFAIAA